MFKNVITISGKPGCGKSTIAELLAKKLDYKIISSGDEMRKIAKKHNMNITDFVSTYLPKHKEIDLDIDNSFINECKKNDNLIIPTRIISQLLVKNNIENFKIYLYASNKIRQERIVEREKISKSKALKEIKTRELSESDKFSRLYRIDINDLDVYNLVLYTHFTDKNVGKIKLKIRNGNGFFVKYVEGENTLPSTLAKIIINEYNEYVRRNKKR